MVVDSSGESSPGQACSDLKVSVIYCGVDGGSVVVWTVDVIYVGVVGCAIFFYVFNYLATTLPPEFYPPVQTSSYKTLTGVLNCVTPSVNHCTSTGISITDEQQPSPPYLTENAINTPLLLLLLPIPTPPTRHLRPPPLPPPLRVL
jgi:hypothetical protein